MFYTDVGIISLHIWLCIALFKTVSALQNKEIEIKGNRKDNNIIRIQEHKLDKPQILQLKINKSQKIVEICALKLAEMIT